MTDIYDYSFTWEQIDEILEPVAEIMDEVVLAVWDGCHKIYLALDQHEADRLTELGYTEHVAYPRGGDGRTILSMVKVWFTESCPLRFVNAVRHNPALEPHHLWGDQTDFIDVVPQFALEDRFVEEEDDGFCEHGVYVGGIGRDRICSACEAM